MDSSHATSLGKCSFCAEEFLAWPVFCEILKGLLKTWVCQVILREGRGKKGIFCGEWRCSPCACCVLWTPLQWHLLSGSSTWESCRWEKCWIKAKCLIYLRPGLQGPSPAGLYSSSSATASQPTRQRLGSPACSPLRDLFQGLIN